MGVLAVSELEGTPTIAAPSKAAAAVTASKAVFKFTSFSVSPGASKGLRGLANACVHTIVVA
jgi:hypothetical protein